MTASLYQVTSWTQRRKKIRNWSTFTTIFLKASDIQLYAPHRYGVGSCNKTYKPQVLMIMSTDLICSLDCFCISP